MKPSGANTIRNGHLRSTATLYLGLHSPIARLSHPSRVFSIMAAPYKDQNTQEVARMLSQLDIARKDKRKGGFSCKKTTFDVKGSPHGITVDSWRMQDWDYKKSGLPTYARGLFTTHLKNKQPEIAVRGYDKFFNVDEVPETKWKNIRDRTKPPYELTLKENGCIIFIAGLEDDTLIVCSKHSTGDRNDVALSHASAGETRLEQQLRAVGKTKVDLARELRSRNVTAVAELCDDSFEEHILAYGPDSAGLYLHGMNLNLPRFATYPSSDVQEFADAWGFRKTGLKTMSDIDEVKKFLEEVAETGAHDGRDVEGFVIRCKMSLNPGSDPYEDWFFKYKFEEPYLMYRQWRECTKALIMGKSPKYKKHGKITEQYLMYARKRIAADPQLGKLYNQNHGIIALRNDFLDFKNINGADAALMDERDPVVMSEVSGNVVICPIATIGCGKTTLALALSELFGWGHIQNDNISGKNRPPRFTKAVLEGLKTHPAVFADRNNAQRHERKQIITDIKTQHTTAKIVCFNFHHDSDALDEIRRVTQERVISRGDNHQTIHAASNKDKFINVMDGFIGRFEACDTQQLPDNGFDVIIDLDPVVGSRKNLETAVAELSKRFPNLINSAPSKEQLDHAMELALAYRPDFKHNIPDHRKPQARNQQNSQNLKKPRALEYIGITVPADQVRKILDTAFSKSDSETSRFYKQLQQTRRVQPEFHVTLIHKASSKDYPELWQRYTQLQKEAEAEGTPEGEVGDCDVLLERVRDLDISDV